MVVQGGASLAQHVEAGAIEHIISQGNYDYIVLQERGGDLGCFSFQLSAERCDSSFSAHDLLISYARRSGAEVILLGTYDPNESAAAQLTRNEAAIARRHSAAVVHLAPLFLNQQNDRAAGWLHQDGMHPGPLMTLAAAAGIYREIFKIDPAREAFPTSAYDYSPRSKFDIRKRVSEQHSSEQFIEKTYSRANVEAAVDALRKSIVPAGEP